MQREGDLPLLHHLVDGRVLCGLEEVFRNPVFTGGTDNVRVMRIEHQIELTLVEILLVSGGIFLDFVRVIEHHADVTDTAHAAFAAQGGFPVFKTRVAEDALFALVALRIEIDLLVRAGRDALAPAAALVLVDQHHAILFALVDGARGAGGGTGRIEAVLAQTRQVQHEACLKAFVSGHILVDEVGVGLALGKGTGKVVLPVRTVFNLVHQLARDQRVRTCRGRRTGAARRLQALKIKRIRFVVVRDFRLPGVAEDFEHRLRTVPVAQLETAVDLFLPAAAPLLLVFPALGVACTGLGFHVIEPHVFGALMRGPDILAGYRAGMAADALVQIQHHADLCGNFHFTSFLSVRSPYSHSTLSRRRSSTNSSRFAPIVP